MFKSVDQYLAQLVRELAGVDPAVIQDALADSEDHLRTGLDQMVRADPELPVDRALAQVIEEYGNPAEVAAGYRQFQARTRVAMAPAAPPVDKRPTFDRFFEILVDPRAYASFFYMCFSLITGIVYFTWAIIGISMSVGFAVLIVGLPFAAAFLVSVRALALVEGRIVEALLGVRMPSSPLFSYPHLGMWERVKTLFQDSRTWTTILYMICQMPLGTIYFSVCITLFSLGISLIATPVAQLVIDSPIMRLGGQQVWVPIWSAPFFMFVGVLVIMLTLHLAKAVGQMHGRYAKALLVRDPALHQAKESA